MFRKIQLVHKTWEGWERWVFFLLLLLFLSGRKSCYCLHITQISTQKLQQSKWKPKMLFEWVINGSFIDETLNTTDWSKKFILFSRAIQRSVVGNSRTLCSVWWLSFRFPLSSISLWNTAGLTFSVMGQTVNILPLAFYMFFSFASSICSSFF